MPKITRNTEHETPHLTVEVYPDDEYWKGAVIVRFPRVHAKAEFYYHTTDTLIEVQAVVDPRLRYTAERDHRHSIPVNVAQATLRFNEDLI